MVKLYIQLYPVQAVSPSRFRSAPAKALALGANVVFRNKPQVLLYYIKGFLIVIYFSTFLPFLGEAGAAFKFWRWLH